MLHLKQLFPVKILFGLIWLISVESKAQSGGVLDTYIQEGISNNLMLQNKHISLEQSLLTLKDAKSLFLPAADFGANYTLANGGRQILLPIGDLLNGVYSSLNTLLDRQAFPQVENVAEQFLPNNFYDARVRISYPVFNPDLHYNKVIKAHQVELQQYELDVLKSELTKNIKQAYFQYCMAYTARQILEDSRKLVAQSLRDNQALLANGSGLPAQVLRAESEVENVRAMLIEAENKLTNAGYYVNFLVNRPLNTPVPFEAQPIDLTEITELMQSGDYSQRAELMQLATALDIQHNVLKMQKSFAVPRLNSFLDLGMQGFDFAVDGQSRYYMLGLNLSVPIFHAGRNRNAIQQAQLELNSVKNRQNHLNQQLSMGVEVAKNQIQAAKAAKLSAESNFRSAAAYLRLVDRGYKEGTYSLIEFIDARNQYTSSELRVNLADYTLLAAKAQLERELETSK
jgi:outer membrane protein